MDIFSIFSSIRASSYKNKSLVSLTAILVGFFAFSIILSPAKAFACRGGCPQCEPDPAADLSGEIVIDDSGRATVVNSSDLCDYEVGLAVYKDCDGNIEHQELFDSDLGTVDDDDSLELEVSLPDCAYQIDLFYGELIESFAGDVRYGDRLIDADHSTQLDYCCQPETLGSITVCKIIIDPQGEVTDGSQISGAEFSIAGLDPEPTPSTGEEAGVFSPQASYVTPLGLNADLLGGDQINDAECVTYEGLALGNYYYSQEEAPAGWAEPRYNDQFSVNVTTLEDFFSYSGELFDGNASNDEERDTNADGHIVLTEGRPDRTLVVLNQYQNVTIKAFKVVCDSEADLPNWGLNGTQGGEPAVIASDTAQQFVDANECNCRLESDWDFQWGWDGEADKQDGNYIGAVPGGMGWYDFDSSTAGSNPAEVVVAMPGESSRIWVREDLQEGYVPFANPDGSLQDDVSAEVYCYNDILNFDNYDYINNPQAGETYYCVAFNAPAEQPPVCDPQQELVINGGFEEPVVETDQLWDIFHSVPGWSIQWMPGASEYQEVSRPLSAYLELHRGVNGWLPAAGEQYAELDTDWDGPGEPLNNEPASVLISQDIPTVPGYTYKVSFAFSPRPGTDEADNQLQFSWDGDVKEVLSEAGNSQTDWTDHEYSFAAASNTTRLEFADLGTQDSLGTFLDKVSVTCQPEPQPVCGNGVQESGEECDAGLDNGVACVPAYNDSCSYCSETCTIIQLQGPYCGDGIVNGEEQCEEDTDCDCGMFCEGCMCQEQPQPSCIVWGKKFYDDNENQQQDGEETGIYGWTIELKQQTDCEESQTWADEVIDYSPGLQSDDSPIDPARTDASNALGPAQNNDTLNFVSLGFGGTLTLKFDGIIINGAGNDLAVTETSYGSPSCAMYAEKVRVYASQTGEEGTWQDLGTKCLDSQFDLGALEWAQYVKLEDASDPEDFSAVVDGYDVDGVQALHCLTGWEVVQTTQTGEDGSYCFEEVEDGSYRIAEVMQEGWFNTTLLYHDIVITGQEPQMINFGNKEESQPPEEPVCGNGIEESGEECDAGIDNGVPCVPAYGSDCSYCSETCTIIDVTGAYCGDGTVNGEEQCEQDSDCTEGMVCNGCACQESPEPECQPEDTQSCDTGQFGICSAGTETCSSEGFWGSCVRNQEPTTENCSNGLDDDCDSYADNGDPDCQIIISGGGGGGGIFGLYIFQEHTGNKEVNTVTVTWFTNTPATSRVIYDTVSHPVLGAPPNYGYAFSNTEDSTKVTYHSMTITGLIPGVTYYWRAVSHGSPEVLGDELSFQMGTSQPGPEIPQQPEQPIVEPPVVTPPETGGETPQPPAGGSEEQGTSTEEIISTSTEEGTIPEYGEGQEEAQVTTTNRLMSFLSSMGASLLQSLGQGVSACLPWWIILVLVFYSLYKSVDAWKKNKKEKKVWIIWTLILAVLTVYFFLGLCACLNVLSFLVLGAATFLIRWYIAQKKREMK